MDDCSVHKSMGQDNKKGDRYFFYNKGEINNFYRVVNFPWVKMADRYFVKNFTCVEIAFYFTMVLVFLVCSSMQSYGVVRVKSRNWLILIRKSVINKVGHLNLGGVRNKQSTYCLSSNVRNHWDRKIYHSYTKVTSSCTIRMEGI